MTITRSLPAYSLFLSSGFDFEFDYEIEEIGMPVRGEFESVSIGNYSDSIGSVRIEILFLAKNKIFSVEEEMVSFILYIL